MESRRRGQADLGDERAQATCYESDIRLSRVVEQGFTGVEGLYSSKGQVDQSCTYSQSGAHAGSVGGIGNHAADAAAPFPYLWTTEAAQSVQRHRRTTAWTERLRA